MKSSECKTSFWSFTILRLHAEISIVRNRRLFRVRPRIPPTASRHKFITLLGHPPRPWSSRGGDESVAQGGTFCRAHMWPASGDSDAIKARIRDDDGRERKTEEGWGRKRRRGRERAGWTSLFANLSESHVRWCAHPRARTENERERKRENARVPCIMHVHRSLVSDGGPVVSKKCSLLRPVWEWARLSITRDGERDAIH